MTRGHRVGMTLIEVLVTLAIVAVMTTIVVLGIGGPDRGLTVQTEANKLAERISLAADEVMVTRRRIALVWDSRGYQFVTPAADGSWMPDTHELLGQRHDLPRSLSLTAASPALIDMTDASLIAFELSLTDASRSATVVFDGLNVSTSSGAARS